MTKRFNKTCEASCTTIILNSKVTFFPFVRILQFVLVFTEILEEIQTSIFHTILSSSFIFFLLEHSAIVWVVLKEYHFSIHVFKIRSIDEPISAYKQLQVSNDNSARARWLTTVYSIFQQLFLMDQCTSSFIFS